MRKFIAAILIFTVLSASIVSQPKPAKANPALLAIPFVEVSGELITALLTLIAAGLTIHTPDAGIGAAKAYIDSGHAVSAPAGGQVSVAASDAAEANTWLNSWESGLSTTNDTFTQPIGNAVPITSPANFSPFFDENYMLNSYPVTNTGLNTFELKDWQGIKDWVTYAQSNYGDYGMIIIGQSLIGDLGAKLEIHDDMMELYSSYGAVALVAQDIASVTGMRILMDVEYDEYLQKNTMSVGFQITETGYEAWHFPSDLPMIGGIRHYNRFGLLWPDGYAFVG